MAKTEMIRFRITPELKQRVEEAAKAENRSTANYIENLILKALEGEDEN